MADSQHCAFPPTQQRESHDLLFELRDERLGELDREGHL